MKTKGQLSYILSTNFIIIIASVIAGYVYYYLSYQVIYEDIDKLNKNNSNNDNENNKKPSLYSFFLVNMLYNIVCNLPLDYNNKTEEEREQIDLELNQCVLNKSKQVIKTYRKFIIAFGVILLLSIICVIYAVANKKIYKISRKSVASNVIVLSLILLSVSSWKLYQYRNFKNRYNKYTDLLEKLNNLNQGEILFKNADFLLLFSKVLEIRSKCHYDNEGINENKDILEVPRCIKILIREKAIYISVVSISTILILISLFIIIRK